MTVSTFGASALIPGQSGAQRAGVKQTVNTLFQDIKSGNMTAAKSDFGALSQMLGGGQAGGADASSSPFSAMLNQVGSSLSSGNMGGAQSAISNFQAQGLSQASSQGQAADAAAAQLRHHHHGAGAGTGKAGVGSLISTLQSDGGDDSSDGTQSAGGSDMFSQIMASVGQSMANSEVAGAQNDMTKFTQNQKVGSALNVSA
jgi:hypothetical protein